LGPNLAVEVQRSALGWIGFVEAVSLDWAERGDVSRSVLTEALAGTLAQALDQWSASGIRSDHCSPSY
jgi:hypothetical protein